MSSFVYKIFRKCLRAVSHCRYYNNIVDLQVRESYKKWWRGKVAESDILSKYFSSSESRGSRGLVSSTIFFIFTINYLVIAYSLQGHFSSLRTSTFRLSRHRSTFHSTNTDTGKNIEFIGRYSASEQ